MKKMTKKIELTNVYGNKVTIEPIEYNIAITIAMLQGELSILNNSIGKLFGQLYNNNIEDIGKNKAMKTLIASSNNIENKINALRKENNYYYAGLNNLDSKDIEYIKAKYKNI